MSQKMKKLTPRTEEKLAKEEIEKYRNRVRQRLRKIGHKRMRSEPLCTVSLSTCSEFPSLDYYSDYHFIRIPKIKINKTAAKYTPSGHDRKPNILYTSVLG